MSGMASAQKLLNFLGLQLNKLSSPSDFNKVWAEYKDLMDLKESMEELDDLFEQEVLPLIWNDDILDPDEQTKLCMLAKVRLSPEFKQATLETTPSNVKTEGRQPSRSASQKPVSRRTPSSNYPYARTYTPSNRRSEEDLDDGAVTDRRVLLRERFEQSPRRNHAVISRARSVHRHRDLAFDYPTEPVVGWINQAASRRMAAPTPSDIQLFEHHSAAELLRTIKIALLGMESAEFYTLIPQINSQIQNLERIDKQVHSDDIKKILDTFYLMATNDESTPQLTYYSHGSDIVPMTSVQRNLELLRFIVITLKSTSFDSFLAKIEDKLVQLKFRDEVVDIKLVKHAYKSFIYFLLR